MSLAFTFSASTSFFTFETSPFRQASNSSLNAPALPVLVPPESGVEPGLVPSVVVGELAVLLVLLELELLELLLLELRAGAGELLLGEAGVTSPSAGLSPAAPRGGGEASSAGTGGEPGGVAGREEPRGGEDSRELGCCEERRGVAIFTTQQSPVATKTLLTASCRGTAASAGITGITVRYWIQQ